MANDRNKIRRVSGSSPTRPQNKASQYQPTASPQKASGSPGRSGAASGGSRGGHSSSGHKKKRNSGKGLRWALLGLAVALVVVAVLVMPNRETDADGGGLLDSILPDPKFDDGVLVEGVNVSGMTQEEARPSVLAAAEQRLGQVSLALTYEDQSYPLSATELSLKADVDGILSAAMDYKAPSDQEAADPEPFFAAISADPAAVTAALERLAVRFNTPAVEPYAEASTDIEAEEFFTYHEGEPGKEMDVAATVEKVLAVVEGQEFNATIPIAANTTQPTRSLSDIQANTQFIASYTTKFRNSSSDTTVKNRVFNIRKAAGIINGLTLQPGEEWSFNDYVGLRTVDSGWKEANGISGGKEYTLQAGGGICQVSTTLYNALLCGNVNIIYRKAHSIPSDYVPLGLDATVDSSGIDFQFSNDTGETLYVFMRITKNAKSSRYLDITVSLYGKPLPEGVTYKPRSETIETTPRDDTIYKADASIPMGYQLQTVVKHDGYIAEAYVDKYQGDELVDSRLLQQNKYRGNPAEVSVGTGDISLTVPAGATTVGGTVVDEATGIPVYVDTGAINSLLNSATGSAG